jgi:hypothetical protein
MKRLPVGTAVATAVTLGTLIYGAKAAALFDLGGNALLADLLANATKQLAVTTQSLAELRRSYSEVKKVAQYADDAADAARSFQRFSAQRFGPRFLSDLDAAQPDLERYRRDALGSTGMAGSEWGRGTDPLQQLSTYCLPGSGPSDCVRLPGPLDGPKVLAALDATFGPGGAREAQARAVDAEVAAAIQGDVAQARVAALQKARVRELLRQCNSIGDASSARDAKRLAEECRAAAEQAQLLHLEVGQETNIKLGQIARLQAVGIEQKNGELKRELAEQAGLREGLTAGLENLAGQRLSIRSGGLGQ